MKRYGSVAAELQARRGRRLRRWLTLRVGIWLAMVAIVIALNLLIGGRFWGIGFIVMTGFLLLARLVMVFVASKRRGVDVSRSRERGIGPRSPAG